MVTIAKTRQPVRMPRFGHRVDKTDPILRGCVGWWPLNDGAGTKAVDISGNGNDGTESGGVSWASTTKGTAASFDGVDDHISSSATSTSPATWSAWVYHDHLPSIAAFIAAGNASTARNDIWASPSHYRMWAGSDYVNGTSVPKVGEWQHIVGFFDGASSKLYVDGVLEATGNPGSQVLSGGITIGRAYSGSYRFDGLISNVRLYNRALSATEVARLYSEPWAGLEPLSPFSFFSGLSQIYAYYSAAFLQRLG